MPAAELAEVTQAIRSSMGPIQSGFARAVNDNANNNSVLSKVIKDVHKVFSEQKRDISNLSNAIEESISENQHTTTRIDRMSSILQETISIQTMMHAELKNIGINMRALNDNTAQMNSAIGTNQQTNSVVGILGSLLNTFKTGAWLTAGAAVMGGAGLGLMGSFFGGAGAGGVKEISNPVQAGQIYDYLTKDKGIDKEHAVGIMANIQNESKFDSGVVGDNGTSGGLFQHHNERFAAMMKAAGPDWQHNWKKQIDFAMTEGDMQKYLQRKVGSGQEAARAFVYDFERPLDKAGEAEKRAGNVGAVEKLISSRTTTPETSSQATPAAPAPAPMTTPAGHTANDGHSHGGMISGPMSAASNAGGIDVSKVKLIEHYGPGRPDRPEESILNIAKKAAAATGMESITATSGKGNWISAAGRAKGQKTTMHSTGLAVDLGGFSSDQQKLEFIKNAKAAGAKGVGVYNNGSVHIDLGKERSWNWGMKDDAGFKAALGAGTAPSQQGDAVSNMGPTMSEAPSGGGEQQQQQSGMDAAMSNPLAREAIMAMIGGGGGMADLMGMATGGLAGVLGDKVPQFLQQTPTDSESLSNILAENFSGKSINEAAVQKQAQQETAQEAAVADITQRQNKPEVQSSPHTMNFDSAGYHYNHSEDRDPFLSWANKLGLGGSSFASILDNIRL